jgi:hypothetical protein
MKAQNIKEAISVFDPERPLQSKKALDAFFVERTASPINELAVLLQVSTTSPKVLFTGHRGSGKSTELAKLRCNLDDFFIVTFSVKDIVNLFDITYVDVLLAMATELFKKASESKLRISKKIFEDIYKWFKSEVEVEKTVDDKASASVGAALNLYVAKLQSKFGTESSTRTKVREKVEPRLSELLERVNIMIATIEAKSGKKVLMIVEDLDKTDLAKAKEIFCGHAMTLTDPNCSVIYTFPTALRHDNDFIGMCHNFDEQHVLPNFKIFHSNGSVDQEGREQLKRLAANRIDAGIIDDDALDIMIELCGGLPRELVRLGRRAALLAIGQNKDTIDAACMRQAGTRLRNDYRILLTSQQLDLLKEVKASKRVENTDEYRTLLHNLSILEFRNDSVWHDVNPIVNELID